MKRKLASSLAILLSMSLIFTSCGNTKKTEGDATANAAPGVIGGSTTPVPPGGTPGSNDPSGIGAQKLTPPEITGVERLPADGIGTAGVDYTELETGPANDWGDMKIPYFNPLGSKSLYEGGEVGYRKEGSERIEVLDDYYLNTFTVEGEEWNMSIANPEFKVFWLRAYAKKLGAKIYDTPGDTAVFHVYENERSQYWVRAELRDNRCILRVIRSDVSPAGKETVINTADFSQNSTFFYTDCVPGKLQSVTVTLEGDTNSGIMLYCEGDRTYGEYMRLVRKEIGRADVINTKKTNKFIFDDIPITDGQLKWTVSWDSYRGSGKPTKVTFRIDNSADIQPVKHGEPLGMLRVVGVPIGQVEINACDGSDSRHASCDLSYPVATVDNNGNTVFTLPSGYYSVTFGSSYGIGAHKGAPFDIEAPGIMRLIPVNSGEITTVTVPREVQLAYGMMQKRYATFDSAGNIDILDNIDNGDTAKVSIVINDPLERDVFPEKSDITITENGLKGTVTDIVREPAPADIVLVIDSSGSMKNNMQAAIDSAKKFVERLPDNTNIRLVQFEQKITTHNAVGKAEVSAALDKIKANGGTAMYDAVDTALKLLAGAKKPYVVLFSDGADSRELKNQGKGSDLTRAQIVDRISKSGVTVLTIGFGASHDPQALVDMSNASKNGAYYAALDPAALDQAFAAVSGKFGNQFVITYVRPMAVQDKDSDVPVVSFMIDRSGSMDMDPAESNEDVDYRIDIVKNLFHDFIMGLPAGTLMQLGSFRTPPMSPSNIIYDQITTDQKAPVLQGLGQFTAGGGTPIVDALTTAYSYLSTVPSSKKTLIYFTDAALAGKDESERVQLEEILKKMKQDGFRVLFAGLGNEKFAETYQEAFSKAAELSGGEYIITSNIEDIRRKLNDLMNRINTPSAEGSAVDFTISLNCVADDGSRMDYGTQKRLDDFTQRTKTGQVVRPETVKISTGEVYKSYDRQASMLVYGSDRPNVESVVLDYVPYASQAGVQGFTGSNKEIDIKVLDAWHLSTFKGVRANNAKQFLALRVELSIRNDASHQEYLIPSIFQHFYVSLNNVMYPASEATWLAEAPLAEPGNPSVSLKAKEKKTGILVFVVERRGNQRSEQFSLHFYDTAYGHIGIPLAGSLPASAQIEDLPKTAPVDLSETFSLSIDGKTDVTELAGVELYQYSGEDAARNTSFRVIDGEFQSRVQALLNIDPTQRFLYAIETDQGPLVVKMNDIVHNIPLGFSGSTMMAPGSSVPVRMPFQISNALAGSSSYLFADLSTGSVHLPVTTGKPYETGGLGAKWSHEYFDITINSLRRLSKNSSQVVLDFTITDKKDGMGLKDIAGLLALARKNSGAADGLSDDSAKHFGNHIAAGRNGLGGNLIAEPVSKNVIAPSRDTDDLLFGAQKDWAVLDGASRRGILLFNLSSSEDVTQWELNCGVIENLHQPIETGYYEQPALLVRKEVVDRDTNFETSLRNAVTAAIARYQSSRTTANTYATMGLSKDDTAGKPSITPAITVHGRQVIEKIATEEDFLQVMYSVSCVPNGEVYHYLYSPEAVVTQGWGTELDLASLAMRMISRLGYQPRIVTASLTGKGIENAERITGIKLDRDFMPAIAWVDAQGREKVFVIPFMRDISELGGLAYISVSNQYRNDFNPKQTRMTITAHAEIIPQAGGKSQAEAFNSLNSMFGDESGGSGGPVFEDVTLFDQDVSYADMSLDSVDISFAPIGASADGQHEIISVLLDTKQGILYNEKLFIDTSFYKVKSVTLTIYAGYSLLTHTTYLEEGQKLSNIFQTFAFNLPGLTPAAANTLQQAVNAKATEGKEAGDYATVQWVGHAAVNRFARGITDFETENQPVFGIKTARFADYPLALMVTIVSDGQKAQATVDIMQHEGLILNNPPKESKDGYSSALGIYASILEAYALGEDKAVGFMQVWTQLPADTPVFVIPTSLMNSFADDFEKNGAPPKLVERLRQQAQTNINAMFLVPKKPAVIDGKERWAWLEMIEDRNGTRIISVGETGEHSSMAEYIILNAASVGVKPLSAEGIAGFLYGVTCINWGIVTFSLTTDDYASIMAQTKILLTGIAETLSMIESFTDVGSKTIDMSPEDYKAMLEALESAYKLLLSQNKLNPDVTKLHDAAKNLVLLPEYDAKNVTYNKHDLGERVKGYSFADGFQAAIDAYFPK